MTFIDLHPVGGAGWLRAACRAAAVDPLVHSPPACASAQDSSLLKFRGHHDEHDPWQCKRWAESWRLPPLPSRWPHARAVAIRKSGSGSVGAVSALLSSLNSSSRDWHAETQPSSLWTFVRDPLDHLISGYSEVEMRLCSREGATGERIPWREGLKRGYSPGRVPLATWRQWRKRRSECNWEAERANDSSIFMNWPDGSEARARRFVADLFAGRLRDYHHNGDINHAFPQCHWLCAPHSPRTSNATPLLHRNGWLHVGRLENFTADVRTLLSRAGVADAAASRLLDEYTRARATARSSLANASRRHGAQAAMVQSALRHAFESDAGVARSVCYLLIPDYVCLSELLGPRRAYELPAPCRQPLRHVLAHLTTLG